MDKAEQLELIPAYMSVGALADRLGVSRTTVTKDAQAAGIEIQYIKDEAAGKVRAYLALEDAEKLEEARQAPRTRKQDEKCVTTALIHIARRYGLTLDQLTGIICDFSDYIGRRA